MSDSPDQEEPTEHQPFLQSGTSVGWTYQGLTNQASGSNCFEDNNEIMTVSVKETTNEKETSVVPGGATPHARNKPHQNAGEPTKRQCRNCGTSHS